MPEQHGQRRHSPRAHDRAQSSREAQGETAAGTDDGPQAPPRHRWLLRMIRYALPAVVVIGGLVVMSFGDESQLEGGAGIVSAGLAIYFLNWVVRLGASGDREREREEAAREYYTKHGRWPR
jgi:hypothetical protein